MSSGSTCADATRPADRKVECLRREPEKSAGVAPRCRSAVVGFGWRGEVPAARDFLTSGAARRGVCVQQRGRATREPVLHHSC